MAIYRNVSINFWKDRKIADDFTPEDKYFMLYLLTNHQTNLIGCYELSIKETISDTGYDEHTIKKLLDRLENIHKVIFYSQNTKEVLIKNWHKYNWNKSEKLLKNIKNLIEKIKDDKLKKDMVSIGYAYGMDTTVAVATVKDTVTVTVTDTITDTDTVNNIYSYIESNFNRLLSPIEYEEISKWNDNELTRYAISKSVLNGKYNINYIKSILNSYEKNNIQTVQQAQEEEQNFKKKGTTKNSLDRFNEILDSVDLSNE